jgi:hypothetical protein
VNFSPWLQFAFFTALAAGFSVAGEHPTSNWTKRAPLPTGEDITAISHVEGLTVVATSEPKVLTSSDLATFEAIPTGLPGGFTDIAFSGGKWFASGQHIYRSTALASWELILEAENEDVEFEHVFAEGSFLFATFTERSYPGRPSPNQRLFRSSDAGDSWEEMAGAPPARDYHDLLFAKGKYFLAGAGTPLGNGLWVSDDGAAWEPILPGAYTFFKLREIDGEIFALDSDGKVSISGDGINWETSFPESRFSPFRNGGLIDIVKLPTQFLLYSKADYHNLMWESADGRNWDLIEPNTSAYSEQLQFEGLEVIDGVALAFGGDGIVRRATDWDADLEQILPEYWRDWNAVDASGSAVVAVGDGGQVASSADSISWNFQILEPGFDLGGVTFDPVLRSWFAVGRDLNGAGRIFASVDGISWEEQLSSAVGLRGVGSDGAGGVIACGDAGTLLVLEGGVWRSVEAGTSNDLYAIASCEFGWLAVGNQSTLLRSQLGNLQWNTVKTDSLSTHRYASIDCGNGFVVLGSARWFDREVRGRSVSEDLESWFGVGSHDPGAMVFDGVRFVSAERGLSAQPGLWDGPKSDSISVYWRWSLADGVKFLDRIVFVGGQGRIVVSDPYTDEISSWLEQNFPDPSNQIVHADPDLDGLSNAVEYCLGYDPLRFNPISDAIKVTWLRSSGDGLPEVVAQFPSTAKVDAALAVEWSSDFLTWHRLGREFGLGWSDTFPGGERPLKWELPAKNDEMYFRLRCDVATPSEQ